MKKIRSFICLTCDLFSVMPLETFAGILMKGFNVIFALCQVFFTAKFFDTAGRFIDDGVETSELTYNAVIFLFFLLLPYFTEIAENRLMNISINKKYVFFDEKLLKCTISNPLEEFERPEFRNELQRAKSCTQDKGLYRDFIDTVDIIPTFVRFIGTSCVLASFHILFLPLSLLSIVPAGITKFIYVKEFYIYKRAQTEKARRCGYLWKLLTSGDSVKELRTMDTYKYFSGKWYDINEEIAEEDFQFENKSNNVFLVCNFTKTGFYILSIALSIYFLYIGTVSVGEFSACIAAFLSAQFYMERFIGLISEQSKNLNMIGDYYEFINRCYVKNEPQALMNSTSLIELRNVYFSYPNSGDEDVLKNISLNIKKGERVVIVGENGSGKTTLSNILTGVYTPKSGMVLLNNTVRETPKLCSMSVVLQNFMRYRLTLRTNVGIGSCVDMADDSRIISEISKVMDESEIIRKTNGIDGQIGQEFGGAELSGGEWQRVGIARGINKDSDIIVLDEPTSAIDPLEEYAILKKFIDITESKTSVIISHRIGICRFADKVVVMKNGAIVESGTHDELMENDSISYYRNMWHEQAKWYV